MGIFSADSKIQDMEKYRNKSNAVGGGTANSGNGGKWKKHTFCRTGGKNVKNRCRDVPEIAGNGGKTEL